MVELGAKVPVFPTPGNTWTVVDGGGVTPLTPDHELEIADYYARFSGTTAMDFDAYVLSSNVLAVAVEYRDRAPWRELVTVVADANGISVADRERIDVVETNTLFSRDGEVMKSDGVIWMMANGTIGSNPLTHKRFSVSSSGVITPFTDVAQDDVDISNLFSENYYRGPISDTELLWIGEYVVTSDTQRVRKVDVSNDTSTSLNTLTVSDWGFDTTDIVTSTITIEHFVGRINDSTFAVACNFYGEDIPGNYYTQNGFSTISTSTGTLGSITLTNRYSSADLEYETALDWVHDTGVDGEVLAQSRVLDFSGGSQTLWTWPGGTVTSASSPVRISPTGIDRGGRIFHANSNFQFVSGVGFRNYYDPIWYDINFSTATLTETFSMEHCQLPQERYRDSSIEGLRIGDYHVLVGQTDQNELKVWAWSV